MVLHGTLALKVAHGHNTLHVYTHHPNLKRHWKFDSHRSKLYIDT